METPNEPLNSKPLGEFLHKNKKLWKDFPIPQQVIRHEKFMSYKKSAKLAYFYMAFMANILANPDGWFFHSYRHLATLTGLDVKTVMVAVKQLVEDGFLECKDGGYSAKNVRLATWYRVWGGEQRPSKESENHEDDGEDDVGIYGR